MKRSKGASCAKRKCLKEMCRTRWVERHEAFEVFSDLFLPIVSCLEEIMNSAQSDWNRKTRSDANSYLLALSQFSFVVALHACNRESLILCERAKCEAARKIY